MRLLQKRSPALFPLLPSNDVFMYVRADRLAYELSTGFSYHATLLNEGRQESRLRLRDGRNAAHTVPRTASSRTIAY